MQTRLLWPGAELKEVRIWPPWTSSGVFCGAMVNTDEKEVSQWCIQLNTTVSMIQSYLGMSFCAIRRNLYETIRKPMSYINQVKNILSVSNSNAAVKTVIRQDKTSSQYVNQNALHCPVLNHSVLFFLNI